MGLILNEHHKDIFVNAESFRLNLYDACYYSSKHLAKFIIDENVDMAKTDIDDNGNLLLHLCQNSAITKILLKAFPGGVARMNDEMDLPLHVAIRKYRNPEIVHMLIDEGIKQQVGGTDGHGGIFVKNKNGYTPFSLLCHQFSSGIDLVSIGFPLYQHDMRLWENLVSVVKAAFIIEGKDSKVEGKPSEYLEKTCIPPMMLHKIIELNCPPEAIYLAHVINPLQVTEPDEKGYFPLSLALEKKSVPERVVMKLLKDFPAAINVADKHGRFPLHLSASSGRAYEDGVEHIFKAQPSAISVADEDGMFPVMHAAAAEEASIDTIYRLLREYPAVFQ